MIQQIKIKEKKDHTIFWVFGGCFLLVIIMTVIGLGLFYLIFKSANHLSKNKALPSCYQDLTDNYKEDRLFENTQFGFMFKIPQSWGEYRIVQATDDYGTSFEVLIKTNDSSYSYPEYPGWIMPVVFSVYTKAQYQEIISDPIANNANKFIDEKNNYIYTYSHWQDCPQDLCDIINPEDVVKTFKVY